MKNLQILPLILALFASSSINAKPETGKSNPPAHEYKIYRGSTHSHTSFTWSHGAQWGEVKKGEKGGLKITDGVSYPPKNRDLKPNWKELQGPPSAHHALAKAKGYDFYVTTDHSQEATFHPTSPKNAAWISSKRDAAKATNRNFVGLAGFEYSENNGPNGTGHINVINSAEYLNALQKGIDLPYLYKWLKTAASNGEGPVVASFNHPGPQSYNNWAYRDPGVTDIITMLEVINSNRHNNSYYNAFILALDKGWKVSPVAAHDTHGFYGINQFASRTFVLATSKTKAAILDAMKHRRTYASLDNNIQCQYTVNGSIMGSTLNCPNVFHFEISITDPDTDNPKDKVTKIDIVQDGGKVIKTHEPVPHSSVRWSPTIEDSKNKYFFIRVWNAGGGDTPEANPKSPVAWLAPVWTGR